MAGVSHGNAKVVLSAFYAMQMSLSRENRGKAPERMRQFELPGLVNHARRGVLQDAYAIIIYIGRKMSVVLRWIFFESVIEVIFLELKEEWQYPVISVNSNHLLATYPEAARTIDIYTLATTLGHIDDNVFLLKNVSDSANRQRQMRTRIIQSHLPEVIQGLAIATQKYASELLAGDTQLFSKVMEYQTQMADDTYRTKGITRSAATNGSK